MSETFNLENQLVVAAKTKRPTKKRDEVDYRPVLFAIEQRSPQAFQVEPHLCRICFGRVMSFPAPGEGMRFFRCCNCGAKEKGVRASVLCACGLKLEKGDAGIRCVVNPTPTPENPSEIIAKEVK